MSNNEVFTKVKAIIADKLAVDEDSITRDSSFVNDLKADSMDILDLVSGFEEEFDITIPAVEVVAENFNSADAITALVERLAEDELD